jgi:hypothetical protein
LQTPHGEQVLRDGYWFSDVSLDEKENKDKKSEDTSF